MKNVKKKYISSTYLRNVDEYNYNFFEDKENNCYISIMWGVNKQGKSLVLESGIYKYKK